MPETAPAAPAHPDLPDLELLRRYEPVIRYTRGEQFFPGDVERYLAACSLWAHHPGGQDQLLVEQGELTPASLAQQRPAEFGAVHFLKFIEPLDVARLAAFLLREGVKRLTTRGEVFHAGRGRLARVGYGSRLLDALFSLTLLLRGRVPGDTAAAAAITYRQMQAEKERFVYYGRVVREGGWIALQYWFFYPFNNWRSGFHGVNDHEADWEMAMLYLYRRADGLLAPRWAAYASHDFSGDDLRRRWDDADELALVDGHPVIFAGAGSHASYFRPGEYLTEVELPFLTPLIRVTDRIREFWVRTLRQAGAEVQTSSFNIFRIPFVDYARGDGVSIGPGGDHPWTPVLLDPVPDWASQYRGLWGLYARDPISGENAPAGPMYNRDGTVRSAWYDPLGWAGLHKAPTPAAELDVLERRCAEVRASQDRLRAEAESLGGSLQEVGVELAALEGNPHLAYQYQHLLATLKTEAARRKALRKELAQGKVLLQALESRAQALKAGQGGHPRAHIHRLATPASDTDLQLSRWAEVWAAASTGLLLAGVGLLYFFARQFLALGLLGMAASFVFIEAVFRRQLPRLLHSLTLALAILSALVLVYQFFWKLVLFGVLVAGLYLAWENIRELRG